MQNIQKSRSEAFDALMRAVNGTRVLSQINDNLMNLLVQAESYNMLPRKKIRAANKASRHEKEIAIY